MSGEDCPICLESLSCSDELFALPCHKCKYNFCIGCIKTFDRTPKHAFLACPRCHEDYPMDISDVVMLRQAHFVGSSLVDEEGEHHLLDDSELNAGLLSAKRDFSSYSKKLEVESAFGLYCKVMKDGNETFPEESKQEAKTAFDRLFLNVLETGDGGESSEGMPSRSRSPLQDSKDESLFQGLEDCMGNDEKIFLTKLLTSGQPEKLAQAAMILNGILKLPPIRLSKQVSENTKQAKKAEQLAKIKKEFPLPYHMPGYFLVPLFDRKKKFLYFKDRPWDGTMTPPATNKRIFDMIYENRYHARTDPRPVVKVDGVRGPVGRLGLRRGDIITHVNDMEWTGTAEELESHLHQMYEKNPSDVISLTVNANAETAKFLKVRGEMLEQSRVELI